MEGGFVQGMGMFTLEEVRYSQTGSLWTQGPGAYKIPGFSDIPVEFYVHLLRSAPNEKAVFSSKVWRVSVPRRDKIARKVCYALVLWTYLKLRVIFG